MNSSVPKQFLMLNHRPILMHTITKMHNAIPQAEIIVALPKEYQKQWQELCAQELYKVPHQCVNGGENRFQSVKNALEHISSPSLVVIHDGVRPFVSEKVVNQCLLDAHKNGASIPVIKMEDSLRKINNQDSEIVERKHYVRVQTPQCFKSEIIIKAYQQEYQISFTDDASVVESINHKISLCEGNKENIKITTLEDLVLAQHLLSI